MLKGLTRSLFVAVLIALTASGAARAEVATYKIDPNHSTIGFSVRHLVSRTHGRFAVFEGTISLDPADQKTTTAAVSIDAASLTTDQPDRDHHLKSGDFFAVDSFPRITFASTSLKPDSAGTGTLTGNLTIKGITKPVDLTYTILGMGNGMGGSRTIGIEATGRIDRSDFNILWNRNLDDGKTLLGDEVTLEITIEARTPGAKPPAQKTR